MPVGYTAEGQQDKMGAFISKMVETSQNELKLDSLKEWLKTFDCKKMDPQTIDQLVSLAEIAEDKQKIALIDLLRLIVLEEKQAEYLLQKHWELIDVCVIGYIECMDLKNKEDKVVHNYHLVCFKFISNFY